MGSEGEIDKMGEGEVRENGLCISPNWVVVS